MTKKDGATEECRPSAMCAMAAGTQRAALATGAHSGSSLATHPGTASWSEPGREAKVREAGAGSRVRRLCPARR